MSVFLRRIRHLTTAVKAASGGREIPTFEQFKAQWDRMDLLSQNLYIMQAECPEILGQPDEYDKAVAGYIERMGLVTEHYTIADIWEDIDA